jgi:hypothetical protein
VSHLAIGAFTGGCTRWGRRMLGLGILGRIRPVTGEPGSGQSPHRERSQARAQYTMAAVC